MTGYGALLRKELLEVVRTWRIWLVGGIFVLFGIADPVLARFTKQILASTVGDQIPFELPDPTWADAWAQWTKDLSQTLLILVLVMAGATVASEVASGTAILTLTKPVSRAAFVLAKFTAAVALVLAAVAAGTALATAVTLLIFGEAEVGHIWKAVGVWAVLAVLLIAITMVASCLVPQTLAAFGIGFGAYLLISAAGMWQPAREYSFIGLSEAIGLLSTGQDAQWVWPISTGLVATVVCLAMAIAIFRRREL